MSMPRRAMKEMGFQACCLWCDAADQAGQKRCTACIKHHRSVRDRLASTSADDAISQFCKEILAMSASPHRYDHDEVHGPWLIEQQHLAAELAGPKVKRTAEEVFDVFQTQKQQVKRNVLQDISNQNMFKDNAPSPEFARHIGEVAWEEQDLQGISYDAGRRTIPSKQIKSVDRSDRVGEDIRLTDRVHAAEQAANVPKPVAEIVEKATFEEKTRKRAEWKDSLQEIENMLDDDVD